MLCRKLVVTATLLLASACGGGGNTSRPDGAVGDGPVTEGGSADGRSNDGSGDVSDDARSDTGPLDSNGADAADAVNDTDAGDVASSDADASDGAFSDADGGDDVAGDGAAGDGTGADGDVDAFDASIDASGGGDASGADGSVIGDASVTDGATIDSGWPADCSLCHGDPTSPAPPRSTRRVTVTTDRGVGAHRSHLGPSTWRHDIVCVDCHIVPTDVDSPGHIDTAWPAEVTWGALATADGATPAFDGAQCTNTYCHGTTLQPGGSLTTPTWTRVDGTQAACGTCHGLPPGGGHPSSTACSTCHPTVNAAMQIIDRQRHVDGVVDLLPMTCTTCHGTTATGPAPPLDTHGGTATSLRGVGAHASHLRTSTWRSPIGCTDCHRVPTAVGDVGHIDTALPAELTWGALATADGATPAFDGARCTNAYCHGPTLLPGGTLTAPTWTTVDGSQATCGTCHGLPPGGTHPASNACSMCHPTMNAAGAITDPARHINGVVDLVPLTCTTCHGTSATGPAPPVDTSGGTATSLRGVGAHASHLQPSTWRSPIACVDCHRVPATVTDVGHIDSSLPAELTWGALATADAASPAFDGTRCTNTYCHGPTLQPGGTLTTPAWTTVDGSQARCGTCHGLPPGGTHPASNACSMCHPTMNAAGAITDPARHINGVVDVVALTCTTCHGTDATGPAPPLDTTGGNATSRRGVGAHASHLRASTWRAPIACTECHLVPAAVSATGHIDTALPAELTWGTLATADTAAPSFDGTRCTNTYCHGTTLMTGGTLTVPSWTTVDGSQSACGTCHGLPPGGTHPSTTSPCSTCHPTMNAAGTITDPSRHINGIVDVLPMTCTTCHGADGVGPAPPMDTTGGSATSLRSVGAHASHLARSDWRRTLTCDECHRVPATVDAAGHIDSSLPAELIWGALATSDLATPTFDGTRCTNTYCHGTTLLPGGTLTVPTWTTVNGTQAACGTCHGLPPGGTHPRSTACSMCHTTMNAAGAIIDPTRHINGVVDVLPLTCTTCHGTDGAGPAPPRDTSGGTATTARGVGAHSSHLQPSTWRADIACTECHVVPASVAAPGHLDTTLPAELTWGAIAAADAATPSFDGVRCNATYCHGSTLMPGGTNTTPSWTTVDGTQAACGTCHGLPPGGTHPTSTACSRCHPTMDATGAIIDPARHVNGVVDVVALTCTSCHGDPATGPAPPVDTSGGSATTLRGVGAHASHLQSSTWRRAVTCDECHRVPAAITDPGHIDTTLPAELTWGPLATANGAAPAFDGTRCNNAYCHGTTLLPGGTLTTPAWTTVNGTQAACGTCHGRPPGGTHPTETNCNMCHATVMGPLGNFVGPTLHINGIVDRTNYHPAGWAAPTSHGRTFNAGGPAPCQSCHGTDLLGGTVRVSCETCHSGWQTNCTFCHGNRTTGWSSPPEGVDGETARLDIAVGAHTEHVGATGTHIAWNCTMCHGPTTPTSALTPGHIDGDGRAEVVFGPIRGAGTTYNFTTGSCGNTYCHGNGNVRRTAPNWNLDPTLNCGSCHAPFTGATQTQLLAMSGEHERHVSAGIRCNQCHSLVVSATGALLRIDLHVNGIVEVSVPSYLTTACAGRGGCAPTCHGTECWR